MLLLPPPCRNRPPPLDDVNKLRHHCRCQCRAAPVVIHIDRNALFTSSEYAGTFTPKLLSMPSTQLNRCAVLYRLWRRHLLRRLSSVAGS